MSTDRDTTRIVRSWLEEGVTALPDRVLDTVLDQLPATSQRRSWWPTWRFQDMNSPMRIVIAAVVLAAIGVVAISVLPRSGNIGGPSPTPTPTTSPTAPPSPMPAGPLTPGTYLFPSEGEIVPAAFSITVPEGWTNDGWALTKGPGATILISPWAVRYTYGDPCHWQSTVVDPGSRVEGLASALSRQSGRNGTTPTSATLGGFSGQRLELDVPAFTLADCDANEYRAWVAPGPGVTGKGVDEPGRAGFAPGMHSELWILDVNGTRLLIEASYLAEATASQRAELASVVASIEIEP
jgi:hypothetical protein